VFRQPLARRLRDLGLASDGEALIHEAAAAPGWRPLAALDAATQFVSALVRVGGLRRGRQAGSVLRSLLGQAQAGEPGQPGSIPAMYWSALPAAPGPGGEEQVRISGAVVVRVRGRSQTGTGPTAGPTNLSRELVAALAEPPVRPGRILLRLLRGAGLPALLVLVAGLVLMAGSAILETVLLRGAIQIGSELKQAEQRSQMAADPRE
jgi:hypothetical protein